MSARDDRTALEIGRAVLRHCGEELREDYEGLRAALADGRPLSPVEDIDGPDLVGVVVEAYARGVEGPPRPGGAARQALDLLRAARDAAKDAGAPRTLARIRAAIASAGGAVRHAERFTGGDFPPYPCPHDSDGMHSIGCGCDFY